MSDPELKTALDKAQTDIEVLKGRLAVLDGTVLRQRDMPCTWLLSHSFLRRAFAVFGLELVATLVIYLPIYLIVFVVGLLMR